jgi:hypothetical protein
VHAYNCCWRVVSSYNRDFPATIAKLIRWAKLQRRKTVSEAILFSSGRTNLSASRRNR